LITADVLECFAVRNGQIIYGINRDSMTGTLRLEKSAAILKTLPNEVTQIDATFQEPGMVVKQVR
jgi:hypothetical protein